MSGAVHPWPSENNQIVECGFCQEPSAFVLNSVWDCLSRKVSKSQFAPRDYMSFVNHQNMKICLCLPHCLARTLWLCSDSQWAHCWLPCWWFILCTHSRCGALSQQCPPSWLRGLRLPGKLNLWHRWHAWHLQVLPLQCCQIWHSGIHFNSFHKNFNFSTPSSISYRACELVWDYTGVTLRARMCEALLCFYRVKHLWRRALSALPMASPPRHSPPSAAAPPSKEWYRKSKRSVTASWISAL